MNSLLTQFNNSIRSFAKDEEGAQVVEYPLIIALVSIGLVVALGSATGAGSMRAAFTALVARVSTCFTGTCV